MTSFLNVQISVFIVILFHLDMLRNGNVLRAKKCGRIILWSYQKVGTVVLPDKVLRFVSLVYRKGGWSRVYVNNCYIRFESQACLPFVVCKFTRPATLRHEQFAFSIPFTCNVFVKISNTILCCILQLFFITCRELMQGIIVQDFREFFVKIRDIFCLLLKKVHRSSCKI